MTDYTKVPRPALERLAASGDVVAAKEVARRGDEPQRAASAERRPPRVFRNWERPLTSPRYSWWPPTVDAPTWEMQQAARAYWAGRNV